MKTRETRYDRLLQHLKNHRIVATILVLGASVIALGAFTNAVDNVVFFVSTYFLERAHETKSFYEKRTQINRIRKSRVVEIFRNDSPLKFQSQLSDTEKSAVVLLFYDDTMERLLTIPLGYEPGFELSADCISEKYMRGRVALLSNTGGLFLYDFYTVDESYNQHFILTKDTYEERVGNYTILASLETASGTTDTATLELDVRGHTPGNNMPTIELSPIRTVFGGTRFSQQVYGNDPDGDKLSYFFLQAPHWLSINRKTGHITGIAPKLDDSYQFVYTVRVSDGKDFALKTFTFIVFSGLEQ